MNTKFTSNPMKSRYAYFLCIGFLVCTFIQCVPEEPNYTMEFYEGNITVNTDSASTSKFYSLTIHRSTRYTNFISLNGVNYQYLSNGNHLIIDETLLQEANGFLLAKGDLFIEEDSLKINLILSQFTADTTLYFRTELEGVLAQVP